MSTYLRRAEPPREVTLRARTVLDGELSHYFYLSVARFKAGVERDLELAKNGITDTTSLYKVAYSAIGNKRYADGAVLLVREIIESARGLGVGLERVKLSDWWMLQSRGSPRPEDKGNRNIRLVSEDEAKVVLFNGSSWKRYSIGVRVPRIYGNLFVTVAELGISCRLGYLARIVALDMSYDRAYVELQIVMPYELYISQRRKFDKPLGNHIAGIDINVDRVNIAITDMKGVLRDIKTFRYPSLASPTLTGDCRRSLEHRIMHEVLRYTYYHGVSTIVLEDPNILGQLKLRWIKSGDRRSTRYNRRVSMFMSRLVEELVLHAPEYGLEAYYVDPAYTSKLAELIAKDMGLDKHTASAYIIALEYLGLRPRQVIKSIQK